MRPVPATHLIGIRNAIIIWGWFAASFSSIIFLAMALKVTVHFCVVFKYIFSLTDTVWQTKTGDILLWKKCTLRQHKTKVNCHFKNENDLSDQKNNFLLNRCYIDKAFKVFQCCLIISNPNFS